MIEIDRKVLGVRLTLLREALGGVSQVELSRKLGIGDNQIWRYENGDSEPSASVLYKIAEFFGVTTDYLLGRSDEPRSDSNGLLPREAVALSAWRRGDKVEAIRAIINE